MLTSQIRLASSLSPGLCPTSITSVQACAPLAQNIQNRCGAGKVQVVIRLDRLRFVAEFRSNDSCRSYGAQRRAAQNELRMQASFAQVLAHARCVALAAGIEWPVVVIKRRTTPVRFGMAEEGDASSLHAVYSIPNSSFAVSDIISRFHGGSNTSSTSVLATVGISETFARTSSTKISPMPQPGAVSVITMVTFLSPSGWRSTLRIVYQTKIHDIDRNLRVKAGAHLVPDNFKKFSIAGIFG